MALPVKTYTTAVLVSSLMKLIYQMSFQVVSSVVKETPECCYLKLLFSLLECCYSVLSLHNQYSLELNNLPIIKPFAYLVPSLCEQNNTILSLYLEWL